MIVGFAGFGGSGKDTAAEYLAEAHGFNRLSFAARLREYVAEVNPLVRDIQSPIRYNTAIRLYGYEEAKEFTGVREALVSHAVAARKVLGEDVWVAPVRKHIEAYSDRDWAISDVRYANEEMFIKRAGGVVVLIAREGCEAASEEEERSLKTLRPTFILPNNGTVEELHRRIDTLFDFQQKFKFDVC